MVPSKGAPINHHQPPWFYSIPRSLEIPPPLLHCDSHELPQPGVSDERPQDGCQVAQGHKGVVDGRGQVIIPIQKVPEVQDEQRLAEGGREERSGPVAVEEGSRWHPDRQASRHLPRMP